MKAKERFTEEKDVLYWLGPDLAREGLLINDPWVKQNCAAAVKLFRHNQGIQINAGLLAVTHPYAIQYIEQAPVLVLAACSGKIMHAKRDRIFAASSFAKLVRSGKKLKEIMAYYNVPYPLRRLRPFAISENKWKGLKALNHVPPSVVAMSCPERPRAQVGWLKDLTEWHETMGRRIQAITCDGVPGLEWACFAYGRAWNETRFIARRGAQDVAIAGRGRMVRRDNLIEAQFSSGGILADFYAANADRWNNDWTAMRATHAANEWHDALAAENESDSCRRNYGMEWDQPVDYSPLPIQVKVEDLDIIALRSCKDVYEEGRIMKHCVASYFANVARGTSRLYSIRYGEKRLATLELAVAASWDGSYRTLKVVQLKGPCNTAPKSKVQAAAVELLQIIKNQGKKK